MRAGEIKKAIVRAVETSGTGATVRFTVASNNHSRAILTHAGKSRFVVFSGTPSKTFERKAAVGDVKRQLRKMGENK
jgi:hypothetical protein